MNSEYLHENTFTLPGGLILQPEEILSRASLRPLSGHDEEWLARHRETPNSVRVSWLLNQCLLALDEQAVSSGCVRQMLVGDRDFLIMQLRRITLGDHVQAVVICPACGDKMDVDFELDEVAVQSRPQTETSFTINLSGRTVRFRLPNGGDQESVVHDPDPVQSLLSRCIMDDSAQPLSSDEGENVIAAMKTLAPQVDIELDLACPACSYRFTLDFDTTAFFFEEIAVKADQLLREVHALAFYYHWSERQILSLERRRRRAYLALLDEAVRHD